MAIAAGTYMGGWRVIRTMGHRLTQTEAPQGFVTDTTAAAVLLISTRNGYPLSTTHIVAGSVIGGGVGKAAAGVRWNVAGRMVIAWVVTLPAAALVAALIALLTRHGGNTTIVLASVVAIARSRRGVRDLPTQQGHGGECERRPRPRGAVRSGRGVAAVA